MTTRRLLLGASLATPLLAAPALAQAWPAGPVRIIAPFPPGGSVDAISRLLQPHLSQILGVPVLVDNRSGASGAIGTREAARAAPDGNTWVTVFDTHAVNPALIANLGFDTLKDLAPVLLIGTSPMLITVSKGRPWQDFAALLAAAKAKPDTLTYGTISNGSLAHLTMSLLDRTAGTKMIHVPYRGGGPLTVAAAAGEVDLPVATATVFAALLQNGTIKAVASTGATRNALAPEAPTLKELGLPIEADAFWGVLCPAGVPAPIRERMEAALRQALAVPAVAERLTGALGLNLAPRSGPEFGSFLATQIATWTKVVQENGIKSD